MWNAINLVQDLNSCRLSISYDDNHYTTDNIAPYLLPASLKTVEPIGLHSFSKATFPGLLVPIFGGACGVAVCWKINEFNFVRIRLNNNKHKQEFD